MKNSRFRVKPATAEAWLASRFAILRRDGAKGELWIDSCPYCGDAKKVRRSLNVRNGWYHCLRNGCSASLFQFVRDVEGVRSLFEVRKILEEFGDVSLAGLIAAAGSACGGWRDAITAALAKTSAALDESSSALPGRWRSKWRESPAGRTALAYARERSLPEDFLASGRAGWFGEDAPRKWRRRLILGVFERGRLVFFQGRALSSGREPKMLYPGAGEWSIGPSDCVFGLDSADASLPALICEGAISALSAGGQGLAVHGARVSAMQANLIADAGFSEAVFLREPGVRAEDAERSAWELSSRGVRCAVASMASGDANDCPEEVPEAVREAKTIQSKTDLIRSRVKAQGRRKVSRK